MAKGTVNKVILIGRLGSDPEVRYTAGGTAVANFNIATNRSYKNKEGNWQEETDWHRIVVWARQAELAKEYLKKGNRVYIEGRLQTRSWEDQNGQKRSTTEVVTDRIEFLESRGDASYSGSGESASTPTNIDPPDDVEPKQDEVPF